MGECGFAECVEGKKKMNGNDCQCPTPLLRTPFSSLRSYIVRNCQQRGPGTVQPAHRHVDNNGPATEKESDPVPENTSSRNPTDHRIHRYP